MYGVGTSEEFNGGLNLKENSRWTKNCKVYTRKFRRKIPKICNSNDFAATTTSTSENPTPTASTTATVSENPTTTPAPTDVSSASIPPATTAKVSTTSTSEDRNDLSVVSASPTNRSSLLSPTNLSNGNQQEDVFHEFLEAIVVEDADSSHQSRLPHQEQGHSHRSADKNADATFQMPTNTEDQAQSLRESSPLSDQNDMLIDKEVATAQLPIQDGQHNVGELLLVPPKISNGNGPSKVNGVVKPLVTSIVDDRIKFNLSEGTSKNEIEGLKKKLLCELDEVRGLFKCLEAREIQIASYNSQITISDHCNGTNSNIGGYGNSQSQYPPISVVDDRTLMRVNPEVDVMGHPDFRPMGLSRVNSDMGAARNLEPRLYNRQLSVAVMETNHSDIEFMDKEKRTPKANQYYRNSEFLLAKDRLPPESTKRFKSNNCRKRRIGTEHAFGFGYGYDKIRNQVFKSCSSLLQRLMKHKHSWVFNEPVNPMAMGCADYHDIIKQPMDLGTIKTRLSQSWYKSIRDFADDVRLVFRNAMTYNPKGHDVHVMAEELSFIFEERWAIIESEYNLGWKYQMYQEAALPTPTSRNAPAQLPFVVAPVPVSVPGFVPAPLYAPAAPMIVDPKIHRPRPGRTAAPKKPKANDPNKRDMTYEEKQKLSTNLQSLPPEKLDAIVQIIKRRNTTLSQHDDEIEVDIDNVDAETLWELDRFVNNYKKNLSKNRRKAERALQARKAVKQTVPVMENTQSVAEAMIENGTALENGNMPPDVDGERQGNNGSSSSSSSSDSGSSSSDSDSSSSANGSDAGNSPKTS